MVTRRIRAKGFGTKDFQFDGSNAQSAFAITPKLSGSQARERRLRYAAGAARILFGTSGSVKDVVGRSLRPCGSVDQKLAIIAQLLEPTSDIARLITNDRV
jgi:hypothetical protein